VSGDLRASTPNRTSVEFHHIKPEYAEHSLSRALHEGRITPDDRALIEQHVAWVAVKSNISLGRINKLTFHLVKWRRFLPPFRTNSIEDIFAGIQQLKAAKFNGHPYAANTLRDDISVLKKFYLWMSKKDYSALSKEEIKEMKVPGGNTMTKTVGQMLSQEEIFRMIGACTRSIDRAMVATLYEASLRVKELATLRWNQVAFERTHAIINVNVKTGRARHIPLFIARPYLAAWKVDYPLIAEDDAYVFLTEREHKPLRYRTLDKRLKIIAARAGVTKKFSAHVVRHTRISHLIQAGVREYTVRELAWANQNTKMLATYSHISQQNVDDELSRLYGIEPEHAQDDTVLNPRQCPRCAVINSPTARYCMSCGVPLTPEAKMTANELAVEIEQHPIYRAILQKIDEVILMRPTVEEHTGSS
jgi:site-specific recombinase XerD